MINLKKILILILILNFNSIIAQQYRNNVYYINDSLHKFNTYLSSGTIVFLKQNNTAYVIKEIADTTKNLSNVSKEILNNLILFEDNININAYSEFDYNINIDFNKIVNIYFIYNDNNIIIPYKFDFLNKKIKINNTSNINLLLKINIWLIR